ncbi:5'-3' exonuclease H3TH domain-containing protein [Actinoplanes sp. NPDC049265]|uniref:5'-3' exonuclease n=1 Tax=Actinoplanes sp. NPDC049265 TaxID=3363902 RepID=UPI003722CC2A
MPFPSPLLLVLDGNSLLHRAYHAYASDPIEDADGRPVWALRGLVGYVARAAAQLRPDALVVGFDCPESSARKQDWDGYKAHRPAKPAALTEQIVGAPGLLREAGICTVVPPAYEADDVLASSAALARRAGWRSVLMTSDRDAFALIDETTEVLRVRNGGFDEAVLVDAPGLVELCGVEAGQYRDFAALRGDPSDNLHGVRGFGAATSARLLNAFGSVDETWAALDRGDLRQIGDVVGESLAAQLAADGVRERIDRNRDLMRMRTDLPLPELDTARLPLNYVTIRRALRARGINLGPSLWALVGNVPPQRTDEESTPELQPWVFRRSLSSRRDPTPGQLSLF